ncbi:MAG: PAS domain S-box protein [Syntrophobacteraceae bacterium]
MNSSNPEDLLRIFFEEAPQGMFITDPQGRLVAVNVCIINMTGYSRDELLGKSITDLFHPLDLAGDPFPIEELTQDGVVKRERRLIRKDGSLIWVENNVRMLAEGNMLGITQDITDRKREEQVLQVFRFCLDHASDAIEWIDFEGKFTYVNEQECRLLGYSAEELSQLCLWDIDPVYGKERFQNEWKEYRKDKRGEGVRAETLHKRKDGSLFPVEVSSKHLWFGDTEFHVAFVRDITERKRAEQALRDSEERMRLFFERQLVGMAITSPAKGWLKVNKKLCHMLGYSPAELSNLTWTQLTHPEDLSADEAQFQRLLAGEIDEYALEKRFIRKDGALICTNLSVGCVRSHDGVVDYVLALLEDITERKQAEESLRQSEERFRLVVELSPIAISFASPDGTLEYFNPKLQETIGYTVEDIPHLDVWFNRLYPDPVYRERTRAKWEAIMEEAVREGRPGDTMEIDITCRDGSVRTMQIFATPMASGNLAMFLDLTERKRAEEEKKKLQAQLMQSQKLESIGTLAGGVAHEINNPLNGIMNYAQLILDRIEPDNPAREYAGEILRETERIRVIVRNLLTFARHDKHSHSPAQMRDVITAVLSLVQAVMRHDQISLELEIPENLPGIKCRSQQIQQVLMNLMTNARDALNERYPGYSPEKTLRIAVEVITREGRQFIRTTVEDAGTGIPEGVRDRIFDPFFTTKPKEAGTGLGLSISYGIVREHGGELTIESESLRYTRFHMDLPVDNGWTLTRN